MDYMSVKEASRKWELEERRITYLCRNDRIKGAIKENGEWLIPVEASKPLDGRTKAYEINSNNESNLLFDESDGKKKVTETFIKKYKRKPDETLFTPYRVCPIGAHSDHNLGKITGFAIDKGIHIAYGKKMNGVIEIESLQFPKRAQWFVGGTPSEKQGDWADHLRGATIALNNRYPLRIGMSAILDGELPIGGLSSSAAVIITFLHALCRLNNIRLHRKELIEISKEAENKYVGVSCGKLDQSCEIYSRKDTLLYMDLKDDTYVRIPTPENMKPFVIGVFFSGLERSLAGSKFNMRVDELRSAAYSLKALSGMEYGKFEETNCRDIPYETYMKYREKLPLNFMKRADHWFNEYRRVEAGVKAYEKGDIEEFGRLVTESGYSSIYNWETGSPELIKLYEILKGCEGVYGTRFSGAGFKGCCMAIINPEYAESIKEEVERKYLEAFPHLKGKYSAHICHTADGVRL